RLRRSTCRRASTELHLDSWGTRRKPGSSWVEFVRGTTHLQRAVVVFPDAPFPLLPKQSHGHPTRRRGRSCLGSARACTPGRSAGGEAVGDALAPRLVWAARQRQRRRADFLR